MANRSHSDMNRHGFSLIEVVVVLVVMGILTVFFVSGMDVHASVAVEADILRAHLGYAQSLAMANNIADWSVAFGGSSYVLMRDGSPSPVSWPNGSSATYVLPAGVTIASGFGSIDFDEWGAPAADHVVVLSDGTRQRQVSITGFTGLVP